ncbi:acetyltransferase [Vibrio metoecus]|nr:acetyltransferase [Vibrio metoecus]
MRCQPLRRALVSIYKKSSKAQVQHSKKSAFKLHDLVFEFRLMQIW